MHIASIFQFFANLGCKDVPQILNYMWLNKNPMAMGEIKVVTPKEEIEDAVTEDKLEIAVGVIRNHPDTEVNFWLDFDLLQNSHIEKMKNFFERQELYNVKVRNLRDIPEFAESKFFDAGCDRNVWGQIDLLKLYILQHCMNEVAEQDVFFADLDLQKLNLRDRTLQGSMARNGIIIGHAPRYIENQFMGFRNGQGQDFLVKELIPATYDQVVNHGGNGWYPLEETVKKFMARNGIRTFGQISIPIGTNSQLSVNQP